MIRTILALLVFSLPLTAFGQDSFPAPFGLSWEMSEAELKEVGFTHAGDTGGFSLYTSVSAPKAWSKGDRYYGIVYKGRLVKLTANSTDFSGDIYGSEGKRAYNQLKKILTDKYGAPSTQYERIGLKLYDDSDEFYQCLEYSGCGMYTSLFNFDRGSIGISLKGKRRGEGYLNIAYESPSFSVAKDEIARGDISSDEDAL